MTMLQYQHIMFKCLKAIALTATLSSAGALAGGDVQDYSAAERLLFMSNHLAGVTPPTSLHYVYRKSGSLEEGFEDHVSVELKPQPDGSCCVGSGEFLTDARRTVVPEIEGATGNPVILYFLEHDVRNMQRLTQGQPNHFRKRIRMAVYNDAKVQERVARYRGNDITVTEIVIDPYRDDPNRPRFEKFAHKAYQFYMSDAVPGGVYAIRTVMSASDDASPPLILEELLVDGAERLDSSLAAKES